MKREPAVPSCRADRRRTLIYARACPNPGDPPALYRITGLRFGPFEAVSGIQLTVTAEL